MINIGKYIEIAINWLTEHFARFFDVINDGVGGFIDAFQDEQQHAQRCRHGKHNKNGNGRDMRKIVLLWLHG